MAINSANFVRVRIGGVCQDRQGEWEGEGREGRRWEGVKERGERERGGGGGGIRICANMYLHTVAVRDIIAIILCPDQLLMTR